MMENFTSTLNAPTTVILDPSVPQAKPAPVPAKPDAGGFFWGTGRRKTSVARVRVRPGDGKFIVNKRELNNYFTEIIHRKACNAALEATGTKGKIDVYVNINGGGITGQADSILLGLSRALMAYDPSLEQILRDKNYLTRDARKVERKKYGQSGARKRYQFSKR